MVELDKAKENAPPPKKESEVGMMKSGDYMIHVSVDTSAKLI